MAHRFTIGVEEEFQIIDPKTCELRSHVMQLVNEVSPSIQDQVKHEMHQSIVETGTQICQNVGELRVEMHRTRGELIAAAERAGLQVAAAGTHPFQLDRSGHLSRRTLRKYRRRTATARAFFVDFRHAHSRGNAGQADHYRYDEYGSLLSSAPAGTFHQFPVLDGPQHRVEILPHYRVSQIPAHRHSGTFRFLERVRKFHESSGSVELYRQCKKIWWDVRPHPVFGTLEFRMCDVTTKVEEACAIAALTQALIVKLHRLYTSNQSWRIYRRALIEENKWRAARYGIEGKMVDFGKEQEVHMKQLIPELLELVDDVVDDLGSRSAVNYIHTILNEGTSAERQLRVFEKTGDLRAVVQHVVNETRAGTMEPKSSSSHAVN